MNKPRENHEYPIKLGESFQENSDSQYQALRHTMTLNSAESEGVLQRFSDSTFEFCFKNKTSSGEINAVRGSHEEVDGDFVLIFENDEFRLERISTFFSSKSRITKRSLSPETTATRVAKLSKSEHPTKSMNQSSSNKQIEKTSSLYQKNKGGKTTQGNGSIGNSIGSSSSVERSYSSSFASVNQQANIPSTSAPQKQNLASQFSKKTVGPSNTFTNNTNVHNLPPTRQSKGPSPSSSSFPSSSSSSLLSEPSKPLASLLPSQSIVESEDEESSDEEIIDKGTTTGLIRTSVLPVQVQSGESSVITFGSEANPSAPGIESSSSSSSSSSESSSSSSESSSSDSE